MKHKSRYNSQLLKLKKMLFDLHNKKLYNYVMLKIKKRKYGDILKKISDLDIDFAYLILVLQMLDKKNILLIKYQKRKEYLYKIRYYEKIKTLRGDLTKEEIMYLINEIRFEDIKIFNEYHTMFINIFKEIDKQIKDNVPEWLFEIKLDPRMVSISNLMGIGLFIRNNFIHNNKIDKTIKGLFLDPDSLSGTILDGHRYFKIGIFEIFKKQ